MCDEEIINGGSFIFRLGNKKNDIKYFIDYLPMDVKYILEPFGGSFAVINYVYNDDKYVKLVNDADLTLYYAYTHPKEILDVKLKINKIFSKKSAIIYGDKISTKFLSDIKMHPLVRKYFQNASFFGIHKQKIDMDDYNMMKKINFYNMDAFDFLEPFLKKPDTFIFLDPPYFESFNNKYDVEIDVCEIYKKIHDIFINKKISAKIMLVANSHVELLKLFKPFIVCSYDKLYQIKKKKEKLFVAINY